MLRLMLSLVCSFAAFSASATELLVKDVGDRILLIDTQNLGTPTLIGTVTGLPSPSPVASELVAASPSVLYSIDGVDDLLLAIDATDASLISTVGLDYDPVHLRGLAMSPDGTLFAVLPGAALATLDPVTGTSTVVVWISGVSHIEGIDFSPDGTLYAIGAPGVLDEIPPYPGSRTLFQINTTTGQATALLTLPVSDLDSLTFAEDGFLYSADSVNSVAADLWRIDPINRTAVNLGNTGVFGLNGITAIPSAVAVNVDVKPKSEIDCTGVIPVAVLGSSDLDVTQIDYTKLTFEGQGVNQKGNGQMSCRIEDANEDGYLDLTCQFERAVVEGSLRGELLDGTVIEGVDYFCVGN